MRYDGVLDAIGHTPLVRLRAPAAPGVEVYAKLELQNLFAMKDRVAKQVIVAARQAGVLADGGAVVESSSGTMALGLALVGRHLGHPVHIVTDPRIDRITLAKLEALDCTVHVVSQMTGAGWQSARLERLARLMEELDRPFWPRQYHNPDNPLAYRALAGELRDELGHLDVLVGAVGSGGSACGSAAALRAALPGLRLVGVDAVGSMLFAQPDHPQRRQSGLGNSLQPGNIDYELFDEVHWLSDDEAFAATRALAGEQQLFAGNTSGSVYRVLTHLAAGAPPGTRLVGIFPDRGDRYAESVYGHRPAQPPRSAPQRVAYGTAVGAWSYARLDRGARPQLGFVEANTTGTGIQALRMASRLGMEPVLFTKAPQRYAGLDDCRPSVVVCATDDDAELVRTMKAKLSRPAGVATTSEYYLAHVADVAAAFGLPGNTPAAVEACRNKAVTRARMRAAGLTGPRFEVATDEPGADRAVAAVGVPCVVKPVDDSGSHNVVLCHDAATARRHARTVLNTRTNVRGQAHAGAVLVEEYVTGPEFSVEMFSNGGVPTCLGVTAKTTTAEPYFVECRHEFPARLPEAARDEIVAAVAAALGAVGITWGVTHTEVRLGPAGPAVMEINARPAGGMIPELLRLATGVDIVEQHLRVLSGLPVDLAPTRAKHAGIAFLTTELHGRLERVGGTGAAAAVPAVEQVVLTARPGATVRPPRNAYDRLGYLIAAADSPEQVTEALDAALARLTVAVAP